MFLFLVEKGAPPVLYGGIYFKVRSSLKCTPPAEKAAYAPEYTERFFKMKPNFDTSPRKISETGFVPGRSTN